MNIRFISSLTPDDEDRLAPGVLNAIGLLLDQVPIAYTLRIETAGGKVFQHAHAAFEPEAPADDAFSSPRNVADALRGRSTVS